MKRTTSFAGCRETDAATRALYNQFKTLDPYHILYSPITGKTLGKAWYNQAATATARGGAPAFDVYTFEHYELPGANTTDILYVYSQSVQIDPFII